MNTECELIHDLFSLYRDKATSEYTSDLVENHLKTCPECRKSYKTFCGVDNITINKQNHIQIQGNFSRISSALRKKWLIKTIGFALVAAIAAASITVNVIYIAKNRD